MALTPQQEEKLFERIRTREDAQRVLDEAEFVCQFFATADDLHKHAEGRNRMARDLREKIFVKSGLVLEDGKLVRPDEDDIVIQGQRIVRPILSAE
jgi:hypothetical protein